MKAHGKLKKQVNESEILIIPTDKSRRLSVTTREAYMTNIIYLEECADIKRRLNGQISNLHATIPVNEDQLALCCAIVRRVPHPGQDRQQYPGGVCVD